MFLLFIPYLKNKSKCVFVPPAKPITYLLLNMVFKNKVLIKDFNKGTSDFN